MIEVARPRAKSSDNGGGMGLRGIKRGLKSKELVRRQN